MKKKILIIGCQGHIGFSLSYFLKDRYEIIATYNKNIDKNTYYKLKDANIKLLKLNVFKKKNINELLKKYKVNSCIYCAGVAHDSFAKIQTENTIIANCLGVDNFLEAQKKNNFKFIYISTGSVFQNIKTSKEKIDEKVTPSPRSLYSISKRLGEILVENSFVKKKISTSLRVSWVYGPPVVNKKINVQRGPLPYILTKLFYENKKKLKFQSGADFEASFTYIDDVCMAIEKLINFKTFSYSSYHLGSGKNYKLSEICEILNLFTKKQVIKMGKGFLPWTSDSVIRGPIITSRKQQRLKTYYTLKKGIIDYINFLKNT